MIKNNFKKTIISFSIAGILLTSSAGAHAALGDRALFRGVTHNDVAELQEELRNLGYFTFGQTTTYFGSITEDAVRAFQRANGLAVDGSAGPATLGKLNSIISGQTNTSNKPTTTVTPTGGSTLQYNRVLKLGLSGKDVNQLQEALKSLRHLNIGNTTQYFGSMTRDAVMSFQRANKLAVDGFAGPATIQTLNNILSGKISNNQPNRGEDRNNIGLDIAKSARQHLGKSYVFGGNGPNSFDCSGLTSFVYRQFGINLPRTTDAQAKVGTQVSKANLQVGDLVVFSNTYKPGPSHTGIYLGNGDFIHAANANTGVIISNLNSGYYSNHFSYGRRLF